MLNVRKIIILLFFSTLILYASKKEDACVKYKTQTGWSKGYSVKATVMSGSDLNSAVGDLSRFKMFSTYAIVFWDKEKATILELPALSLGSIPMFEKEVKAQDDSIWKIKEGNLLCI